MEEDYITLRKLDLESIIGNEGYVSRDDKCYYKSETRILEAKGYKRYCSCVFFCYDEVTGDPVHYIFYYNYDEYEDEFTIRCPQVEDPVKGFIRYKIRKADSRNTIEYY